MSLKLIKDALIRYSANFYAIFKYGFLLDLIVSLILTPVVVGFFLYKSRFYNKPRAKVGILFDCTDQPYYQSHFAKIAKHLPTFSCYKAGQGQGMTHPPIRTVFYFWDILAPVVALPFLTVYFLFVSLFLQKNFIRAFFRASVVYFRTLYYFRLNPCTLYLTHADNNCSPALYAGFKKAGGQYLFAFQNGSRFFNEGIDCLYMDHFFAIGMHTVDLYKKFGAVIPSYTPVGSLTLGHNQEVLDFSAEQEFDVVFLDQGWPGEAAKFWGAGGKRVAWIFFEFMKRFAAERRDLKIVYQLKKYDPRRAHYVSKKVRDWFSGTNVQVHENTLPLHSAQTALKSKMVVTMYSSMGLQALALKRPVLFFNFTGDHRYDVVSGPLQVTGCEYPLFKEKIAAVLQGEIGLKDFDVDYYVSRNTYESPQIIAAEILKRM